MKTNRRALTFYRLRFFLMIILIGFVTVAGAALAQRLGARWGHYMPRQPMMPLVTPPSWVL